MENEILNRRDMISKAIFDCLKEMYAKSQPEADLENIIEEVKSGKIDKNERIYERHYLSQDEYNYIVDKYVDMYGMSKTWENNLEILEEYFSVGGHKDKYIPDWTDEYGHHPGYRSYESVSPLKEQFKEIIKEHYIGYNKTQDEISQKLFDIVIKNLNDCKSYYRFDREEDDFRCSIALGASPTSNPNTVKQWWKENYNVDIEIEERIPRLFWYYDNGYTDEDLAEEFEDLGPNWKEALKKEWKEEKAEEQRKRDEKIKELQEKYENKQQEA